MSKEITVETNSTELIERNELAIKEAKFLIDNAMKENQFSFSTIVIPFSKRGPADKEMEYAIDSIARAFQGFSSAYYGENHGLVSLTEFPDLITTATVNEETIILTVKRLKTYEHESGLEIDNASLKVQYLSDELVRVPMFVLKELSFFRNKESFCVYIKEVEQKGERFDFKSEAVIIEVEDFNDLVYRYKLFKGV